MIERYEVVQRLLDLYPDPRYLEVGVSAGDTFSRLVARHKIAVDPAFLCPVDNVVTNLSAVIFHEVASDEYFGNRIRPGERFDVIYLDGLHTFEQTLRDLMSAVVLVQSAGCVVIDDVMPSSYLASISDLAEFQATHRVLASRDSQVAADGSWMGDVYRLVFFIQSFMQQFSYATVLENHGQTILWRSPRRAETLVQRKAASVCALEYKDALLQADAMNWQPFDDILKQVAASAWSSS